jgi:DNA-directed RNA polymerase specialized sigma subunit
MTLAGLSDAELVARCRAGDDAAWRELVTRFSRYVYGIAVQAFHLSEHDAETLETLEEAIVVREALGTLSEDCREILDRFFARDESYRTIGEALDLPAGTIASRISRCLQRLRTQLEGKNPGGSSV